MIHPLLRQQLNGLGLHDLTSPPSPEQWSKLLQRLNSVYNRLDDNMLNSALFEQTNDAIFLLDLDGGYILSNQRAADLLGYKPDELTGLSLRQIVMPEEYPQSQQVMRALLDGQTVPPYERTFRHKDGSAIPVEINAQLVHDDEGNPLFFQSIARDIRRRKAAEAAMRLQAAMFDRVHDAIIVSDLDFNIVALNRAAARLHGIDAADAPGKKVKDALSIQASEAQSEAVLRHLIQNGYWEGEISHATDSEKTVPLLASISLLRDENGQPQQILGVSHDLTQIKLREQQTVELAAQTRMVAALRHLLNNFSHDLRTPLTIMNSSLYLLQKRLEPDFAGARYVENLDTQMKHLIGVVEHLIEMMRLDEYTGKFNAQAVQINDVVRQTAQAEASRLQKYRVYIHEAANLPPARGERMWLERALHNLLLNAIQFTPEGGSITLRTGLSQDAVMLEVADTGAGITPEHLAHIFDHFYRADAARPSDKGGLGLGLAIVKKVVEAHQGRIEVESQPGRGSVFRIYLPLAQPPAA